MRRRRLGETMTAASVMLDATKVMKYNCNLMLRASIFHAQHPGFF